jgi:hypothetical protein
MIDVETALDTLDERVAEVEDRLALLVESLAARRASDGAVVIGPLRVTSFIHRDGDEHDAEYVTDYATQSGLVLRVEQLVDRRTITAKLEVATAGATWTGESPSR